MIRDDNSEWKQQQDKEEYILAFGSFEENFKKYVESHENDSRQSADLPPTKTPF